MPSRTRGRITAVFAAVTLAVGLLGAGVASAHVDPDPIAVQAGAPAAIGFKVEHGCSGSPTTKLAVQVPAAITDAKAVDKSGWTSAVAGNVITFTGNLDPATEDHFDITFTAPKDAGEIAFPIVQTCATGEIRWIEPTVEGKDEPEHPAAVLKVTAGPPTAAELTPPTDAPATDTPTSTSTSSNAPKVIGALVVLAALAGGGVVLSRRRRAAHPADTTRESV